MLNTRDARIQVKRSLSCKVPRACPWVSTFKPYIPEHLKVSGTDLKEMKAGNPKEFIKKTDSQLLERRYIHAHLFECGSDWHCFYFSHQDIEPSRNHWKYGCHLHYISHLWPHLKKRLIWNKFNKRTTQISDSIHIRFEPFDFSTLDEAKGNSGNTAVEIFKPEFACGLGPVPLPVAHMATRGLWVTKVRFRPKEDINHG